MIGCAPAQAEAPDIWIEISGSYYNPDWEFRESETGLRLAVQLQTGRWYGNFGYNTIDTAPVDRPNIVRVRGLPFGNWRELTLGYVTDIGTRTSLGAELAYQGLELFDDIESGYSTGVVARHRFSQRFSASLRLAYLDLQDSDWRLTGEWISAVGDNAELVLRIDDFGEYDFTWYEIGLRFGLGR